MNPPSQSAPGQTMSRRHALFANNCLCLGVMLDDREITIIGPRRLSPKSSGRFENASQ